MLSSFATRIEQSSTHASSPESRPWYDSGMQEKSDNDRVSAELVVRFHRAVDLPLLKARQFLEQLAPADRLRLVETVESNPGRLLHDPIEDHPEIGPIVERVQLEVTHEVRERHRIRIAELEQTSPALSATLRSGRGLSHQIWHSAKQRLRDEYGIEWRSPAEMNPWVMFD